MRLARNNGGSRNLGTQDPRPDAASYRPKFLPLAALARVPEIPRKCPDLHHDGTGSHRKPADRKPRNAQRLSNPAVAVAKNVEFAFCRVKSAVAVQAGANFYPLIALNSRVGSSNE